MSRFQVPVVLWGIAGFQIVLALIASVAGWPAQLSTDRTSPVGLIEWLVEGSAVSAPLVFLAGMVVVGVMALRPGALGLVGDALAIAIAGVTVIASLGESFASDPVTTPRVVLVASGILGSLLALLIVVAVIHDLRLRRARPHRHNPAP